MNSNDIPDASALLDVLIVRAVRGEASPWPIDPHLDFKWKGSFEATFEAGKGDKQILLWEINDCAQRGARIPKWAADALYDIMLNGVARGDFELMGRRLRTYSLRSAPHHSAKAAYGCSLDIRSQTSWRGLQGLGEIIRRCRQKIRHRYWEGEGILPGHAKIYGKAWFRCMYGIEAQIHP